MKRQISILACVLMLLAIVFAVASCSQPEAAHVHEYAEFVSKEATCTEKGEVTLTCACGDKYTNETAAKGHNLVTIAAVEPTCTTEGKTEGVQCSDCGLVTVAQSTIAPVGHKLGAAATCTTAQTCELCDHVFVEALGHKATVATCTEPSVCKACGEEQRPALGHKPANDATCTEASICGVCDEVVAEALGHTYPSDCYSGLCEICWADDSYIEGNGNHTFYYECDGTCNKCYQFVNWEAGHQMVYHAPKESTCTEAGNIEYWQCELCGHCWDNEYGMFSPNPVFRFMLPLAEHEYFYECDAHCMNCYELTNENAAHSLVHVEAVDPTCTENGNVEYWQCECCGAAWNNAEATGVILTRREAIIVAPGHQYFYKCDAHCMNCYELTNEEAEHSFIDVAAKAATCTENGNVEYSYCEYCGYCVDANGMLTNRFNVVIPAAGHSYEVACDPVCQVCKYINTEAAHDIVHVAAKAATCTEAGNIEHWYCSYCELYSVNSTLTANTNAENVVLAALGHKGHDYDRKCDTCNLYILPEEGEAFKLYLVQGNVSGKPTYFFNGSYANTYYFGTTTNRYSSPDIFIEEATDGFYMYFMSGTTKKYISVQANGSKNNPTMGSTKGLFTFDQKTGAFITKTSNGTLYLGTYNTYTTISASYTSYITGSNASKVDVSQFILRPMILEPHDCQMSEATCSKASTCSICGKVEGEKLPHTPGPEATCTAAQTCTVCNTTIKAKLAHTGGTATCTEKAKCDVCGTAYGNTAAHVGGTATCTEKAKCDVCGNAYGNTAAHTYANGFCSVCGKEEVLSNATLSFSSTANRVSQDSNKQVWSQNGVTVTNNKAASSSSVANYSNPVRFYASSEVIVEGKGMSTIKFTCSSSSYATALKNSITTGNGVSVSISGSVVTVTFTNAVNSFTIAKLSAQVRVNSITVNP